MSAEGLVSGLKRVPLLYDRDSQTLDVPSGFYTPGFWVVLSAFASANDVAQGRLNLRPDNRDYASAIGLPKALWGTDDYPFDRINDGRNYSGLEHLASPEETDAATSRVNSCIRTFVGNELPESFTSYLCDVVGDLHDNVWSHGRASGFSMAQKWKVPREDDQYLEFALADSGLGFLRELRRVGMSVSGDEEGHSTKLADPEDDWAQSVPGDIINSPLTGIEKTRTSDNHHMGLGLAKLTRLVQTFSGVLWLASGDKIFLLNSDGNRTYIDLANPWQGVAIACRFRASRTKSIDTDPYGNSADVADIMRRLGGGQHG